MSFFFSSTYADHHPFSYNVRRQETTFSRVWQSLRRQNSDHLHDMALTAQPPVLKRSHTRTSGHAKTAQNILAVTEDVLIGVALTVAAALLTRYVVAGVWSLLPSSSDHKNKKVSKDNDKDENSQAQ